MNKQLTLSSKEGKLYQRMTYNSFDGLTHWNNEDININYQIAVLNDDAEGFKEIKKVNSLKQLITTAYAETLKGNMYNLELEVIKGNEIVIEDGTDAMDCWQTVENNDLKKENELLKQQLKEMELMKQFIKEYKAEKIYNKYKVKNNLYWYEYTLRGCSPGCQPKDFKEVNNNIGKFGIVGYDRELSNKELNEYELKEYKAG